MPRPSTYTPELVADICERLANGQSLRAICRTAGFPSLATVMRWLTQDPLFQEQYAQAKEEGIEKLADELLEIADSPVGSLDNGATDSGAVNKQRLQVDTRKWVLSKLAPKKYGDKTAMELTGANGGPVEISDTERAAKIAAILASAKARQDGDVSDLV